MKKFLKLILKMNLLTNLERKFKQIEDKLSSNEKSELINRNYNNDVERINTFFDSEEEKYKNGFNACRDVMLKENTKRRNDQLEEVNEFIQDVGENQQKSLNKLRRLSDSIKANYLVFARGLVSSFESILFRSKFENQLKFAQLVNYSKLLRNEETVSLVNVNHLLETERWYGNTIYLLSSNLILLCSFKYKEKRVNLAIVNKNGDLVRFKELKQLCISENLSYDIQVNATNIIALNKTGKLVEIYNFNLELVHSFKVDKKFKYFELNNYEIALYDDDDGIVISCYDYRTVNTKKKEIHLNKNEYYNYLKFDSNRTSYIDYKLLSLNDKFLFICGRINIRSSIGGLSLNMFLLILNREDNNNIYKKFKVSAYKWNIYNTEVFYNYSAMIYINDKVLSRDAKFKEVVPDNDLFDIYSIPNYKCIYAKNFFEDNLILKFKQH